MSEQEMQFADPDWKPRATKRRQQDDTAVYAPKSLYDNTLDAGQSADASSYAQGYRGSPNQQHMPYAPPYSQQVPPRQASRSRSRSRWWLWVIILIIVVSIISNMSHSTSGPRPYSGPFNDGQGQAQQTQYFSLGNASQVAIDDFSGSIHLQIGDTNPNQVEVLTDPANTDPAQAVMDGTTLHITENPSQGSSDIVVILPSQVAVSLETGAGNIEVDNYSGQVSAQSETGSITLNGDTLSGSSVIKSNSGNIYVSQGFVSGNTGLSTTSGSIVLNQEALSGQFTANAGTSGAIQFNGTLDPQGAYSFTSDQGNIDLTLPANTSMRAQGSYGPGGSFTNDFSNSTGQTPQATVNLKTISGQMHIHKQ